MPLEHDPPPVPAPAQAELVTGPVLGGDGAQAGAGAQPPGAQPAEAQPAGAQAATVLATAGQDGEAPPPGSERAGLGAWLIALLTFAAYATLSLVKYLQLAPGSWDLGIFTEYVKQIAHLRAPVVSIRGAGFNLLGDHFQPIVGLLAPSFRLFPSPATLLVAQALLTAISVVPVCQAARVLLGTRVSWVAGAAYGFSWGLQQMISFDFHEIAFAVPLLAFSLSALVRRRPAAAALWALPLVFVKEDQGLTVAAIGVVMAGMALAAWLRARRAAAGTVLAPATRSWAATAGWCAALLIVWGLGWSVLAITVIIPHFNPTHQYPYWNDGGVIGPAVHLPLSGIAHQLAASGSQKLWTTYLVVVPTAFLALRSPLVLAAIPSLALRFLSTNSYFWGNGWHYNATVMPVVFLAAVDGMARIRARSAAREARALAGAASQTVENGSGGDTRPPPPRRRRRLPRPGALVPGLGAAAMAAVAVWGVYRFPLSTLWHPQTYDFSPHVQAEEAAMARVPSGTTVEATLSMLAPLGARDDTYWVGLGNNPAPAYVVFDQTQSGWAPPPTDVTGFVDSRHPGYLYRQVFSDDGVYVLRLAGRTGS